MSRRTNKANRAGKQYGMYRNRERQQSKRHQYTVCKYCGANLDPGEKCTCDVVEYAVVPTTTGKHMITHNEGSSHARWTYAADLQEKKVYTVKGKINKFLKKSIIEAGDYIAEQYNRASQLSCVQSFRDSEDGSSSVAVCEVLYKANDGVATIDKQNYDMRLRKGLL